MAGPEGLILRDEDQTSPAGKQLILDLFTPPVRLPPTQLLALWHPRCQNDQGHVWLRERLYAAARRV